MMRLSPSSPRGWLQLGLCLGGLVLLTGSLLGARALTGHGQQSQDEDKPAVPAKIVGPVVLGTVDSKDQMVSYGLPPVLQSGAVSKRLVKDGDVVHAGDPLYVFDTTSFQSALKVAKEGVEVAKAKKKEAENARVLHGNEVDTAKVGVKNAASYASDREGVYLLYKNNLIEGYKNNREPGKPALTEKEIEASLAKDPELLRARVELNRARDDCEFKNRQLLTLAEAATRLALQIDEADAVVKQAEAQAASAEKNIELCTIKARLDGTIEQVTISEGSTLGVGTLKPALWLVPAGPRIVRAEIEADFAHLVTPDLKGREVTIFDNTNTKLTYKGRVRRIGETFLPKRSATPGLLNSDTLVLEAEVEVLDAAPPGRPPLRVGQRVRVDLGVGMQK